MKDNDSKELESIYDSLPGISPKLLILTEAVSEFDEFITEGLIDALGGAKNPSAINVARRVIGFVKRDVESCDNNPACLKRFEQKANSIISLISNTIDNPMIERTLSTYKDISSVSKVILLYQLLSR